MVRRVLLKLASNITRLISIVSKLIIYVVVVVVIVVVVFFYKVLGQKKNLVQKNPCPKNFRPKSVTSKKFV